MMSYLNLVLKDSPCENPFASKQKCIAPAVAAGLIAGGTALVNGLGNLAEQANTNNTNWDIAQLNAKMQRETNAKNFEIAQQTNAINRAMLHEQNAFNERMYERQLAYNSPQHMVEMYKAAGLNPAALPGNANQVAAAGELRSGEPKPAERVQMVAPQLDFQRRSYDWNQVMNSVVNAYNQSKLIDSESRKNYSTSANIEVLTDKERKGMSSYLQKLQNDAKLSGWQGRLARQEFNYLQNVNGIRQQLVEGDFMIQKKNLSMLDEQLRGVQFDNQLKQIQALYMPILNDKQLQQMDATMSQISAQIGLINANKSLTEAEAKHEVIKAVGTIIDNGMRGIDYKTKKQVQKYVVSSYESSAVESRFNAIDRSRNPMTQSGTTRDFRDYLFYNDFDKLGERALKMWNRKF